MTKYILQFSLISIFFFTTLAQASDQEYTLSQCSSLVKECFALSGDNRSNCFFSYAHHPFCEGTSVGKLALKRWSMSTSQRNSANSTPGFLGPKLVDKQCLANFDNKLSVLLLEKSVTNSEVEQLVTDLDSCVTEISIELSRP